MTHRFEQDQTASTNELFTPHNLPLFSQTGYCYFFIFLPPCFIIFYFFWVVVVLTIQTQRAARILHHILATSQEAILVLAAPPSAGLERGGHGDNVWTLNGSLRVTHRFQGFVLKVFTPLATTTHCMHLAAAAHCGN